jgi:hypothetical protein
MLRVHRPEFVAEDMGRDLIFRGSRTTSERKGNSSAAKPGADGQRTEASSSTAKPLPPRQRAALDRQVRPQPERKRYFPWTGAGISTIKSGCQYLLVSRSVAVSFRARHARLVVDMMRFAGQAPRLPRPHGGRTRCGLIGAAGISELIVSSDFYPSSYDSMLAFARPSPTGRLLTIPLLRRLVGSVIALIGYSLKERGRPVPFVRNVDERFRWIEYVPPDCR